MKNISLLVKRELGITGLNIKAMFRNKKMRKKFFVGAFAIIILSFYLYLFINFFLGAFELYVMEGAENLFLMQGFYIYLIMTVLFSIPSILSKLYFSNDTKILLPLPISGKDLLLSKIIALSISNIGLSLFITLPMVIKYGVYFSKGLVFYLTAIFCILGVTFISISIIIFLIVFVMGYLSRFSGMKNIFQVLMMSLGIFIGVGTNFLIQSGINSGSDQGFSLIKTVDSLITKIYYVFPQLILVDKSLSASGLLGLGISFLLMIIALFLAFGISLVSENRMIKSILLSSNSKTRKISRQKKEKIIRSTRSESPVSLIMKKEIRNILKTPIYAFNVLSGIVIFPIFFLIPFFTSPDISVGSLREGVSILFGLLDNKMLILSIGIYSGLAISFFIGQTANTAITSISREGKHIWMLQSLPIKAQDQINARLMASICFQFIPVFILGILVTIIFGLGFLFGLGFTLSVLITSILTALIGLTIDVIRPKLSWNTPQEALKQNFNVFIAMIISLLLLMVIGFSVFYIFSNYEEILPYFALFIYFVEIIASILLHSKLVKLFNKKITDYTIE